MKIIRRIMKFFHNIRAELRKVHWPTRREFVTFTSIVLATVMVIGVFFWGLDNVFLAILQLIIRR